MNIAEQINDACKNSDTEFIKNFIDSDLISNQLSPDNQLNIIKCIFESDEIRDEVITLKSCQNIVSNSCRFENFNIMKYLIEQSRILKDSQDTFLLFSVLMSISYGRTNFLDYILNSFSENASLDKWLQNGSFFNYACEMGTFGTVEFLLKKTVFILLLVMKTSLKLHTILKMMKNLKFYTI